VETPASTPSGTGAGQNPASPTNEPEASTAPNGGTDSLEKYLPQAEYFEAPKLFDPTDKTVKLSPAPIHMAVYKRPAGESPDHSVQVRPISITAEKARRDAVGWTSSSK
jgi:hypothetical protein